ncbi:hypothetical protein DFH28DRAFT_708982 [Melampsora americana]|nr:hypothetical protein DFH28DRAFT_708982 [Melampsora americana]
MSPGLNCSRTAGRGKLYSELKALGIKIIKTPSRENPTQDVQNLQLRTTILTRRSLRSSQMATSPPISIGQLRTPIIPVQMVECNTPKKLVTRYDFQSKQGGRKRVDPIDSPTILITEPIPNLKRRRSAQAYNHPSRRSSERLAKKRNSHPLHSHLPLRKSLLTSNLKKKKHVFFESRALKN